jgi:hypothetical protein
MRFEELAYAVDGLPATVRFHARLTIVCVPEEERAGWIARLLGVLEGTRAGDSTSAIYLDRRGRRTGLDRDDQGGATLIELATGVEVPYSARHLSLDGRFDWFASIGLTSRAASDLILVDSEAFTADKKYDPRELEAELKAAQTRLARLAKQHQSALTRSCRRDDLCSRIADLDEQLGREEAARARRRHAEAAAAVQRLEAELATSQGVVPPEWAQAEAVLAAAGAADDWWRAMGTVDDARRAFGSRARLEGESLTRALARPTEGDDMLELLAKACRVMAERRDELVARLDAGAAAEVDEMAAETRRELIEEVEPAYVDALAALADGCRPFGVTIDAARIGAAGVGAAGMDGLGAAVLAEVAAQMEEARGARLQQALEDAQADCPATRERLEHHLAALGLPTGGTDDLAAGAEATAARSDEAAAVLATPLVRRPYEEIEADLETARAALADCPAPDPVELPGVDDPPPAAPVGEPGRVLAERARLAQALHRVERNLPDVTQLAERHSALEQEVAALVASLSAGRPLVSAREAEMILLRRAAEAGREDRRREPLPLVVNDALAPFGTSDKRRLLDVVARLTETTQVVYLTDDPDTLAWASGRAASDEITFWRPEGVATVA